jgi:pheromone shutdown protein TraB
MSFHKLSEYIRLTETDDDFIVKEMAKFAKLLPTFADVIINERDEYISQTLFEISRVGFRQQYHHHHHRSQYVSLPTEQPRGRVVAVVGAGHLPGIQRWLSAGGVNATRLAEISQSSKHPPTWPGSGMLQVINPQFLYSQKL